MGLPQAVTLMGIASCFGMGIGVMALLLNRQKGTVARQSAFVTKALKVLDAEPEVKKLLGDQVDIGVISFVDGFGKLEKKHVQLRVPIKGENDNAYLYAYARKNDEKEKFRLYKLEATFGKIKDKKLILLDKTNEPDEEEEGEEEEGCGEEKAKKDETKQMKDLTPEERKRWAHEMMMKAR